MLGECRFVAWPRAIGNDNENRADGEPQAFLRFVTTKNWWVGSARRTSKRSENNPRPLRGGSSTPDQYVAGLEIPDMEP